MAALALASLSCGLLVERMPEGQVRNIDAQDRMRRLGSVDLHYREWPAAGRDIFLQHGFGSSTYTFEWIAPALQQAGFHVWALDLPGFGYSDKPADGDYDPRALLGVLHAFLDDMGLRELIFVGHSLGGGLAWMTALQRPDLVDTLVLIDGAAYLDHVPTVIQLARLPAADLGMDLVFGRWAVRWVLGETYWQASLLDDGKRVDAYYNRLRSDNMLHAQTRLSRHLLDGSLFALNKKIPQITQPTLIIWGRHDAWLPLEQGQRLDREIPDSDLVVIEEAGHMPQEERPALVVAAILAFVGDAKTPVLPGQPGFPGLGFEQRAGRGGLDAPLGE